MIIDNFPYTDIIGKVGSIVVDNFSGVKGTSRVEERELSSDATTFPIDQYNGTLHPASFLDKFRFY